MAKKPKYGSRLGLTVNDIQAMVAMRREGKTSGAIGLRFGVSESYVRTLFSRLHVKANPSVYTDFPPEPTEEEIAERAKIEREKHFAKRRASNEGSYGENEGVDCFTFDRRRNGNGLFRKGSL